MRYYPRFKIYKASNVTFNPETIQAYSYGWWRFVDIVEGKVIFNNYRYSVSTCKHQSKVRALLNDLKIKIDIEMPLPNGILKAGESSYRNGENTKGLPLSEMIVEAEEHLCNAFLENEIKKQERYLKAKFKKQVEKVENYLETDCAFRDYEIRPRKDFGSVHKLAVHQCIDMDSMESDIENAINTFVRDGFSQIVFYVGGEQ